MLHVEPARTPGFITSPRVEEFVLFLEATGGAPPDACHLVFKKAGELYNKARAAGYALSARLGNAVLWLPSRHFVVNEETFRWQYALGWFFARLVEAGGRAEDGTAVFPNGKKLRLSVRAKGEEVLAAGENGEKYAWAVIELKKMKIGECVRKIA
ncbi:MAG: hypothetical protein K6U74_00390 [Firmicutes bacterium]|nr:hypothetical protein [Bacillota bacterium]